MASTETVPNVFKRWPRRMGKVLAQITIENAIDPYLMQAGAREDIRKLAFVDVLVDTGASHLFMPLEDILRLGLPLKKEVDVETANGHARTGVYEGARVTIGDRTAIVECVGLPHGVGPLLGCQALEALGVIPDVINHRLIFMPEEGESSWITAYRA